MRFKTLFFLLSCLFVSSAFAVDSEYSLQLKNDGFSYPITVVYKSGNTELGNFSKIGFGASSDEKTFKLDKELHSQANTLWVYNDHGVEICQIDLTIYLYHQTQKAEKLGKYTGCTATHVSGFCDISATSCSGKKTELNEAKKPFVAIKPSIKMPAIN